MFECPLAYPAVCLPEFDGVVVTRRGKDHLVPHFVAGHPEGVAGGGEEKGTLRSLTTLVLASNGSLGFSYFLISPLHDTYFMVFFIWLLPQWFCYIHGLLSCVVSGETR